MYIIFREFYWAILKYKIVWEQRLLFPKRKTKTKNQKASLCWFIRYWFIRCWFIRCCDIATLVPKNFIFKMLPKKFLGYNNIFAR